MTQVKNKKQPNKESAERSTDGEFFKRAINDGTVFIFEEDKKLLEELGKDNRYIKNILRYNK